MTVRKKRFNTQHRLKSSYYVSNLDFKSEKSHILFFSKVTYTIVR